MERSWTCGNKTYIKIKGFDCFDRELDRLSSLPTSAYQRSRQLQSKSSPALEGKLTEGRWQEAVVRRAELLTKITPAEAAFKVILNSIPILFYEQQIIQLNKYRYRIADFFIPARNIVIEIDGGYHQAPVARKYDKLKDKLLRRRRIRVARFTNDQVLEHPQDVREALLKLLRS